MPVTEGKLVVVPYTAWKFVLHACQVLGPGNVRKGFVGQIGLHVQGVLAGVHAGRFRHPSLAMDRLKAARFAFDGYYARKPQTPLAEIHSPICHRTSCSRSRRRCAVSL